MLYALVVPPESTLSRLVPSLLSQGAAWFAPLAPGVVLNEGLGPMAPDVVIVDAIRSIERGIVELECWRPRYKRAKYLVIANNCDDEEFVRAVVAGMDGYMRFNDLSADGLQRSIHALMEGEFVIPGIHAARLLPMIRESWKHTATGTSVPPSDEDWSEGELTVREKEVLQLLALGARNRDIAERLFISVTTVNKHVQSILNKLEVHSRTAAVRKAMGSKLDSETNRAGPPLAQESYRLFDGVSAALAPRSARRS